MHEMVLTEEIACWSGFITLPLQKCHFVAVKTFARLSQYTLSSKSIRTQRSHNRLELFGFTLVFYGRLHKHENFSCHKTFPPLEQRVGKEGSTE